MGFRGYASMPGRVNRRGRTFRQVHILDTEAQTLEDACDIIAAQQRRARSAKVNRENAKKATLGQEFARAQRRSFLLAHNGQISLAGGTNKSKRKPALPKIPHPFRDLPEKEKIDKLREMYASGQWGFGTMAIYQLSRKFGITKGEFAEIVEGIVPRM